MKEKVKGWITDRFKPDHELGDDEQLLESNIIDSFGTLELAEFLESEFGIKIPDQDLVTENIGTINLIVATIEKMKS
ncbi:MAG: acyl carrier protein [Planctomycetota bacterium]|nr:MAG: acyl carrier protein [Planctomycetota bacterium]